MALGVSKKNLALMSEEAYITPKLRSDGVAGFEYLPDISEQNVAVFSNPKKKVVVYAYKGTSNLKDLLTDITIAIPSFKTSGHYKKMLQHFQNTIKNFKNFRVILSGHSLGGTTAVEIEKVCDKIKGGCYYVVFNRGSSPLEIFTKGPKDSTNIHYHVEGDKISKPFLRNEKAIHHITKPKREDFPHVLRNFT